MFGFLIVYCTDFITICFEYAKSTINPERDIATVTNNQIPVLQSQNPSERKNSSSSQRLCYCCKIKDILCFKRICDLYNKCDEWYQIRFGQNTKNWFIY